MNIFLSRTRSFNNAFHKSITYYRRYIKIKYDWPWVTILWLSVYEFDYGLFTIEVLFTGNSSAKVWSNHDSVEWVKIDYSYFGNNKK